ncbi:hypothetical protein [Mucisphaera calidilacus]|uniref:Uncharacterized protein n=1 Tax=Mucisphaera calidilacus TaxID=2527982 RepID=A0A518BWR0_9BACT|nr:hypothetical protein [Mucisphaera calidilacus]QDU71409.1 hypothetical protein Pan265_12590 [Mucisphaera calidilacus]
MPERNTSRRLRLVRPGEGRRASRRPETLRRTPAEATPPKLTATDPRWVMAVRVAEAMEPAGVLPADKRERLTRMGRMMGLTPFDISLIVAVIQDQVRRGHQLDRAASAGADQLAMILLKKQANPRSLRSWLPAIIVTAAILAAEAALLIAWLT